MTVVALILAAGAAALGLSRWRRLPAVPLLILAGILLNALGVMPAEETVRNVLLLGLTFLVFFVGAELDPARVRRQGRAAVGVGLVQFLLLGGLSVGVMRWAGFGYLTAFYMALAVTASSTLMVVTLLRERQQFFEPFGRMVVGVLLLQDLLVITLLPLLTRAGDGPVAMAAGVAWTLVLLAVAWGGRWWVGPMLFLRIKLKLEQETLLLAVLSVLFLFVGVAHALDLPLVTGAFLAGVTMSGFPVRGIVRGQVSSLADFFLVVFFVTLGSAVSLPEPRELAVEGALLAGVLLLAPPLIMLIARRAGLTVRSALEGAHLLGQCGEFGLVVVILGVQQGHVGENVLGLIVLLAVVTMMVTPFLSSDAVTWGLMRWLSRFSRQDPERRPRDHVLILGFGSPMRPVVAHLLERGRAVVVVDDDAAAVQAAREMGAQAVRGDGADFRLLRVVRAREARAVVSAMRRPEDNTRLLRFVQGPRVLVRVFTPGEGAQVRELGGEPIVESEAAATAFLRWFDQRSLDARGNRGAEE